MPDVSGLYVVRPAAGGGGAPRGRPGVPEGDDVGGRPARRRVGGVRGDAEPRSARPVAPVMTFNNWPADNEVVPAEQTLAALVTMRPRPLTRRARWRRRRSSSSTPGASPSATTEPDLGGGRQPLRPPRLRLPRPGHAPRPRASDGSSTSSRTAHRAATEEDDFHEVALAYQAAGLALSLVDLQQLAGRFRRPPPTGARRALGRLPRRWAFSGRESGRPSSTTRRSTSAHAAASEGCAPPHRRAYVPASSRRRGGGHDGGCARAGGLRRAGLLGRVARTCRGERGLRAPGTGRRESLTPLSTPRYP